MTKIGEGGLKRFSDLELTMKAGIELSGKRRSEGRTSLAVRVAGRRQRRGL